MIQRIIKIASAIGIFICMFIPLSQCTYVPHELAEDSIYEVPSNPKVEPKTTVLVVSKKIPELELVEFWIPFTFIAPLMFSMPFHQRKKRFIIIQSLQTLYVFWLSYFVFNAVYIFYEPLAGGYILTALAIVFGLITTIEWFKYGKKT